MKTSNKILSVVLFVFIISVFFMPGIGLAGLWENQQGMGADSSGVGAAFGQTSGNPVPFQEMVARIINVVLGFLGIIFMVLLLWAGFKWMTSEGNETVVSEAKGQIRAAVIGLAIVLMSYSIASFVTRCFYDINTGSGTWMCVF